MKQAKCWTRNQRSHPPKNINVHYQNIKYSSLWYSNSKVSPFSLTCSYPYSVCIYVSLQEQQIHLIFKLCFTNQKRSLSSLRGGYCYPFPQNPNGPHIKSAKPAKFLVPSKEESRKTSHIKHMKKKSWLGNKDYEKKFRPKIWVVIHQKH